MRLRGRLLLGHALVPGTVVVADGRIVALEQGGDDATDIVAPGFVDLQINGAFGVDVATGGEEALRVLRRRLPETGVTGFLATLPSATDEVIAAVRAAAIRVAAEPGGARLLGVHLEGPFLAPARAGAHAREVIAAAHAPVGAELVTLAPERPGALAAIRALAAGGTVVSLGHTDASFEEMIAAADAGATLVTHLWNAMSPLGHRAPGAVGAALVDDRLTVGLIADGVHVHPAALRLAVRAKGVARVALVSDAVAAAGMPPGVYTLAGQVVHSDGATVRLGDGTLAGSTLTLDAAVRNLVAMAGAPVADALRMAAETPARVLGRAARIAVGEPADLVVLDASLRVRRTLVAGETVYT